MPDINFDEIATRCSICLNNSITRYNYIELGIANLIAESQSIHIDDRFGYSELICIQCMSDLVKDMKYQQLLIIERIIDCQVAGLMVQMHQARFGGSRRRRPRKPKKKKTQQSRVDE